MANRRIWFITGASRGFGRVWAKAALARGDCGVATARDTRYLSEFTESYGDAVLPLPLDVTDRDAVFAAVRQGHEYYGRLDIVLSNAGYGLMGAIEEANTTEVRQNFETNVIGSLSLAQAAIPVMRQQKGGHILAVASISGLVTFALGGIYQATKFAVEGLFQTLAKEVEDFGIKVTIVEPGPFKTSFLSGSSVRWTTPNPVYQAVRERAEKVLTPEIFGDPLDTIPALFKIVDSPNPPLQVILGPFLPMVREAYAVRIKESEAWDWSKLTAGR
jgi:NAD(P)-dependent dehydrogenase (short-subunit alcohol dehydrogenase family)